MSRVDNTHLLPLTPFRRLAISDLLLLTLIVGLTLGMLASEFEAGFKQRHVNRLAITLELLDWCFSAVLAFALLTLVVATCRGLRWQFSPGHWLIVIMGPVSASILILTAIRPLITVYWTLPRRWQQATEEGLFVVVLTVTITITLWCNRRLTGPWRVAISAVLLQQISLLLWTAMFTAQAFEKLPKSGFLNRHALAIVTHAELLVLVTVMIAAAFDLLHRTRRDWLHWTAVLAVLLGSASRVANWKGSMIRWWGDLLNYLF
jgi:hypothetical protein